MEVPAAEINVPEVVLPEVEVPAAEINVPEVVLPEVEIPAAEINVPEVVLPQVEVPAAEINVPEVALPEVEVPVAEVETPVVEEKPLISIFDRYYKKAQSPVSDEEETAILPNLGTKVETETPKTLVESLMSETPSHLISTLHASQKIKLEDIPIHKQYLYVQRVFTGNNVRFRIIIDKTNNANSRQEVEEIVEKYILSNPDIRAKDPVVEEFLELLRSRFTLGGA